MGLSVAWRRDGVKGGIASRAAKARGELAMLRRTTQFQHS
jgi:hypothetical protein